MATLKFFKNYNNYFNRIVKHDYSKATMNKYETVDKQNINFDKNSIVNYNINKGDENDVLCIIKWL